MKRYIVLAVFVVLTMLQISAQVLIKTSGDSIKFESSNPLRQITSYVEIRTYSDVVSFMDDKNTTLNFVFEDLKSLYFTNVSSNPANYANVIYSNKSDAFVERELVLPIQMRNTQDIMFCQFDLCLPKGFSVKKDEDGADLIELNSERISRTHTCNSVVLSDGVVRITCYSSRNAAFVGKEGDFLYVTLVASSEVEAGDYEVSYKNIVMIKKDDNSSIEIDNVKSIITVPFVLGDINNDGRVNVVDVSTEVNWLLNGGEEYNKKVDINSDGKINVVDVSSLVNLILSQTHGTPDTPSYEYPSIITGDARFVTWNSAFVDVSIEEIVEENPIQNWGVLLSIFENPNFAGSTIMYADVDEVSTNVFIEGLAENRTYYYRAFANTKGGVVYGEVKSFKTSTVDEWTEVKTSLPFTNVDELIAAFPYRQILDATHSSAQPFMSISDSPILGAGVGALVSSPFDANVLFTQGHGSLVCYGVHNIAGTYQDFSTMIYPKVTLDLVMMQYLFGMDGYEGHIDVYVSETEINSAEDWAAATLIGSTRNNGQASEDYIRDHFTSEDNPMTFDIPSKFWGPCYIYLSNKANYNMGFPEWNPDLGVLVMGVDFSSLQRKNN